MTFDQLIALFSTGLIPLVGKLFFLFLLFLYGIFAAIVLRQVQLMNKIVTEVSFSQVLFGIALVHFIAVVAIFLLTIVLV